MPVVGPLDLIELPGELFLQVWYGGVLQLREPDLQGWDLGPSIHPLGGSVIQLLHHPFQVPVFLLLGHHPAH